MHRLWQCATQPVIYAGSHVTGWWSAGEPWQRVVCHAEGIAEGASTVAILESFTATCLCQMAEQLDVQSRATTVFFKIVFRNIQDYGGVPSRRRPSEEVFRSPCSVIRLIGGFRPQ